MFGPARTARRRLAVALAGMLAATAAAAPAEAAEIKITITDLRSADGNVHISIYDKPKTFPNSKGMLREQVVKARAPSLEVVFSGLAPGTYAVAAFHDENGNRKFDQGFLGLPLEDYGFSNDAAVFFGAPSFDAAAFAVSGDVARIAVRMKR